jgi:hypothetical protein
MKAKEVKTVKVKKSVHTKVAKAVAGTDTTIGEFFELAAEDKLKNKTK